MADELIDICDENNNIIGQMMKHRALAQNLWHRTARIFVYTAESKVLIQLRAKNKKLYPNRWDVGAGESYIKTAIRETNEELGILIPEEKLDLLMIEKCSTPWLNLQENIFAATYLAKFHPGQQIKIQPEEIQEIKFIHINDLEIQVKQFPDKFTPHPQTYWSQLIDGVRQKNKTQI